MPYSIDFSGLANVNPYVNTDFTFLDNNVQILSGALETTTDLARVTYNVAQPPAGTISAKVTLSEGPNSGDWVGPAILKSNGEGYHIRINYSELRMRSLDAAGASSALTPSSDTSSQAVAAGDVVELQLDTATNELRSYVNDVLVLTRTDTTYTQGDGSGDFYVGFVLNRLNNGGDGVTSFESSSIGAAPATPTIDNIDTDNSVQVGQTGVIITTTDIDPASATQSVTLGGEALTINSWAAP